MADLRKILQLPLTKLKVILALLKKSGYIEGVGQVGLRAHRSRSQTSRTRVEFSELRDEEVVRPEQTRDDAAVCRDHLVPAPLHLELLRRGLRRGELRGVRQLPAGDCGSGVNEGAATGGFKIADVVHHPKFGLGTVERTERDLVTVLFPSVGYKTLLATAVRHRSPKLPREAPIRRLSAALIAAAAAGPSLDRFPPRHPRRPAPRRPAHVVRPTPVPVQPPRRRRRRRSASRRRSRRPRRRPSPSSPRRHRCRSAARRGVSVGSVLAPIAAVVQRSGDRRRYRRSGTSAVILTGKKPGTTVVTISDSRGLTRDVAVRSRTTRAAWRRRRRCR